MAALNFHRSTGGLLKIDNDVVSTLYAFKQMAPDAKEAGGILLGRHLLDEVNLVVDRVTSPQPSDKRARFSFFRSRAHHLLARQVWQLTDQTSAYLGLWHTHPEPDPKPSLTDIDDWKKALAHGRFTGSFLYFLIIGQEHVRVWEGSLSGEFHECRPVLPTRNLI